VGLFEAITESVEEAERMAMDANASRAMNRVANEVFKK
jgi:hypothetical protein